MADFEGHVWLHTLTEYLLCIYISVVILHSVAQYATLKMHSSVPDNVGEQGSPYRGGASPFLLLDKINYWTDFQESNGVR